VIGLPRRPLPWLIVAAVLVAVGAGVFVSQRPDEVAPAPVADPQAAVYRQKLFDELRPVKLTNCTFARFGEENDGGYVLCANLLGSSRAAYSYGIDGYDGWGCDISTTLKITVHQYDCFNLTQPRCPSGRTVFHPECVAGAKATIDRRPFDTIANQMAKNGDAARYVVMKMDIEGAEWDSLGKTPGDVLERIDQLAIELHGSDGASFAGVVQHLKQYFHVVHIHPNNWGCNDDMKPFPSWAYQVLFVNKRVGIVDPTGTWSGRTPADAPDNAREADCEFTFK
jgi:hypothetical protein